MTPNEQLLASLSALTPKQRKVHDAFWQALKEGRPAGSVVLSRIVGFPVKTPLGRLRNPLGLLPVRGVHSADTPEEWRDLRSLLHFPGARIALGEEEAPPPPAVIMPPTPPPPTSLSQRLLADLQRHKDSVFRTTELADRLDVSPRRVLEIVEGLTRDGFNLYQEDGFIGLTIHDGAPERHIETAASIPQGEIDVVRFGVLGDTHLCSKKERLDVLNSLYDWYAEEGVTTVYHAGNWIEGEARFNVRDRKIHGMDNQLAYMLEHYPQRPGVTTKLIAGDDHEGWYQQREGISIGRHLIQMAEKGGRSDFEYLGYVEADIEYRNAGGGMIVRVMHPGGGKSYALSYKPQKIVEAMQGGEKPAVLFLGHYHTLEYLPHIRNVRVYQTGCTVEQGAWAHKNSLDYHLGGWLISLHQCRRTGACIGATTEDRTFFDKGYYQRFEDKEWSSL